MLNGEEPRNININTNHFVSFLCLVLFSLRYQNSVHCLSL